MIRFSKSTSSIRDDDPHHRDARHDSDVNRSMFQMEIEISLEIVQVPEGSLPGRVNKSAKHLPRNTAKYT